MVQLFFWSPKGYQPLKDNRSILAGSHGWLVDGGVYGVAIPKPHVHPQRVVDILTEAGVIVLPSIHDKDTKPHPDIAKALSKFGITDQHLAHDIAKIMHQNAGMPSLRPHLY